MISIVPCQRMVSDRFPVVSFVVHVPSDRVFEIACATNPLLFRSDHYGQRTASNFFTSRSGGLLRAPAGQATYLLPAGQLHRFAGQTRLYYALASYSDPSGREPRLTVSPAQFDEAPFIRIAPEFTGRWLDQRRIVARTPASNRYGSAAMLLTWGGDQFTEAMGNGHSATATATGYDDGHDDGLWREQPSTDVAVPVRSRQEPAETYGAIPDGEPNGFEDAPALRRATEGTATVPRVGRQPPVRYGEGRVPPPRSTAASRAVHGEPPGAEDARELSAPAAQSRDGVVAYGRRAVIDEREPDGAEHAADLSRRMGLRGNRYGGEPAVQLPDVATAPSPSPAPGVDDEFDDGDGTADVEGTLPFPVPGPGATDDVQALTIRQKLQIILPVAAFESGSARYAAVNADSEFNDPTHPAYQRVHHGLHWGLVQVTQRSGALGRTLLAAQRRDAKQFADVFGPAADELLRITNAATPDGRVQAVDGAFLWQEPWLSRFTAAGAIAEFQAAQNEVAVEGYFDPNLSFAACVGFDTDLALAMLFDRCINMGNRGGCRWVLDTVSPLATAALRQAALDAIGCADVRSFQQRVGGLTADGNWGTKTHAALLGALRALATSPIALPSRDAMLDRMVESARGRRFEQRVAGLRHSAELSDTRRELI